MSRILFKIYLAGLTPRNKMLVSTFREICSKRLEQPQHQVLIIDILKNPTEAEAKKILATPTIIREKPYPEKRVIGDFRDSDKAEQALNFLIEDLNNQK